MTRPIADSEPLEHLRAGFTSTDSGHACLFCDHTVTRGHIYPQGSDLVEAELAMAHHVTAAHGSAFDGLLALGKKGTGLSDTQRALLGHFRAGLADREIQPLVGGVSLSTIRNHRFALREKARQARVFVALMDLLQSGAQDPGQRFIEVPGKGAANDERFAITRQEFDGIVRAHFPEGPDGRLVRFPRKEKRRIAVLIQIVRRFEPGRRYTQAEVNGILGGAADDHVTLRRYLVDYGLLGRTRDGAEYWVQ